MYIYIYKYHLVFKLTTNGKIYTFICIMYNWYKAAQSKYYVNDTNDTMEKQNKFLSSFKFFRHGISKISLKMIMLETS